MQTGTPPLGRTRPGRQGPQRAFGIVMLAGLALPAFAQDKGAEAAKELPAVNVQADAEQPDGYRASTTRVGKVLQDPHDIPQAVTTVTNKLMEEQQVGSLKEAMRNVSGVTFNAAEGGRSGDNMNLRGFYTFGDVYLDGIRDTAQYNRETFNSEQIDVLRGAGAMLFGRGQAGGVINQVTKTPLRLEQYKLTGSLGSHGYREATADLNKAFTPDIRLRVSLMRRDEGSWRENPADGAEPDIHRKGIGLSLGLNQTGGSRLWLNHYFLRTRDNLDYGVSFDPLTRQPSKRFPAKTYWGIDRSFDDSDTSMTTLVHELDFANGGQLRSQLRYADYQRSYWAKQPNLTTPPNAAGSVGGNVTRAADYETLTLQSDYTRKLSAWGMPHEVLVGFEYLKELSARNGLRNFGTLALPDFRPYEKAVPGNPVRFKGDSYALYAQDTIEFVPRWKFTLGARRDEMDAGYASATSPQLKFGEWSYRGALSFHPGADTHYYLGWSDSFSPTADLYQLTVKPQPPERSEVVELGAKWLLLDGDLALRAALYRATKLWERNTDLESTAAILTRKRRTDGIELEAAGRISENWEVFSGLALMDARIFKVAENINPLTGVVTYGNPGYEGKRARNTPRYTFNLWTSYKLGGGWKIGGGVEAKGERYGMNPSGAGPLPMLNGQYHPNTAPAYTRWDAMLAYEQKSWAARLNIRNLFDRLYWDSIYDNGGFAIPGPRRALILTGELKF